VGDVKMSKEAALEKHLHLKETARRKRLKLCFYCDQGETAGKVCRSPLGDGEWEHERCRRKHEEREERERQEYWSQPENKHRRAEFERELGEQPTWTDEQWEAWRREQPYEIRPSISDLELLKKRTRQAARSGLKDVYQLGRAEEAAQDLLKDIPRELLLILKAGPTLEDIFDKGSVVAGRMGSEGGKAVKLEGAIEASEDDAEPAVFDHKPKAAPDHNQDSPKARLLTEQEPEKPDQAPGVDLVEQEAPDEDEAPTPDEDEAVPAFSKERLDRMRPGFETLSPLERNVLLLRIRARLPLAVAAYYLNQSSGSQVKKIADRAIRKLLLHKTVIKRPV
jgi:hypothetical protein